MIGYSLLISFIKTFSGFSTSRTITGELRAIFGSVPPPIRLSPLIILYLIEGCVCILQQRSGACAVSSAQSGPFDPTHTASVYYTTPQFLPLNVFISTKKLFTLLIIALCYIVFGGLVFHAIESPHERSVKISLDAHKARFIG